MSGSDLDTDETEAFKALKAHAEGLERQLREAEVQSAQRLRFSELKAEAIRAGIVDLDGLRLLDQKTLAEDIGDAGAVIAALRQEKPWLFAAASSSSAATVPSAIAAKKKLAVDMSVEEWRAARAALLRRR